MELLSQVRNTRGSLEPEESIFQAAAPLIHNLLRGGGLKTYLGFRFFIKNKSKGHDKQPCPQLTLFPCAFVLTTAGDAGTRKIGQWNGALDATTHLWNISFVEPATGIAFETVRRRTRKSCLSRKTFTPFLFSVYPTRRKPITGLRFPKPKLFECRGETNEEKIKKVPGMLRSKTHARHIGAGFLCRLLDIFPHIVHER